MKIKITSFKDMLNDYKTIDYTKYRDDVSKKLKSKFDECQSSIKLQEGILQDFFEQYPCALLGAISDVPQAHNVLGNLIISQPRILDYTGDRKPDFVIVTRNSEQLFFNFIEIEDPSKKIFPANGKTALSSQFHDALSQLHQWQANENSMRECCDHLLKTIFSDNFDVNRKTIHINYVLLYGDKSELSGTSSLKKAQFKESFFKPPFYHSTYSRVMNNIYIPGGMFCVKRDAISDTYKAVGMVPFKNYGSSEWSDFHNITGKNHIILTDQYLDDADKQYLNKKIASMDTKSLSEVMQMQQAEPGTDVDDGIDELLN